MIVKQPEGYMVQCPMCEYDYTHHQDVFVYERSSGEDGQTLMFQIGAKEGQPVEYNPSKRRNAVSIVFFGECGHVWEMNIIQHKGQTFIEFA